MSYYQTPVHIPAGQALFDATGCYRYRLSREWVFGEGTCLFIMLNPSTADAIDLDPTVRRCVGFAQRWGYRELHVGNIFAWKSTDPKQLTSVPDPIGPDNFAHLDDMARAAAIVICAWGTHGTLKGHGADVARRLRDAKVPLWCLGVNQDGTPKHPLYLSKETQPEPLPLHRKDDLHATL